LELARTPQLSDGRTRSPFFRSHLFHDFDFEVSLCEQLLQSIVFDLKRAQPLGVGDFEATEPSLPDVNRLLTDAVFLRHLSDSTLIDVAQNLNDLLVTESALFLWLFSLVRKGSFSRFSWSEKRPAGQS